jgi:hypothetical protein
MDWRQAELIEHLWSQYHMVGTEQGISPNHRPHHHHFVS